MSTDRHQPRPLFAPSPGSPSRDDVLAAAHDLLAQGLKALTVRALCERLDTSRQLVYSRFGHKAGLLEALYVDGFRQLRERVEASAQPMGSAERLFDHGVTYRRFAAEQPHLFALMFFPTKGFTPSSEALEQASRSFGAVTDSAAAYLGLPADDPASGQLARDLWTATHGLVALERAGHPTSRIEGLLRRMLGRSGRS